MKPSGYTARPAGKKRAGYPISRSTPAGPLTRRCSSSNALWLRGPVTWQPLPVSIRYLLPLTRNPSCLPRWRGGVATGDPGPGIAESVSSKSVSSISPVPWLPNHRPSAYWRSRHHLRFRGWWRNRCHRAGRGGCRRRRYFGCHLRPGWRRDDHGRSLWRGRPPAPSQRDRCDHWDQPNVAHDAVRRGQPAQWPATQTYSEPCCPQCPGTQVA